MVLGSGYLQPATKLQEAPDMMHGDVRSRLSDAINDTRRGTGNWGGCNDRCGDGDSGDVVDAPRCRSRTTRRRPAASPSRHEKLNLKHLNAIRDCRGQATLVLQSRRFALGLCLQREQSAVGSTGRFGHLRGFCTFRPYYRCKDRWRVCQGPQKKRKAKGARTNENRNLAARRDSAERKQRQEDSPESRKQSGGFAGGILKRKNAAVEGNDGNEHNTGTWI